jgi:RNA polymerase sigma-B factor
MQRPASAAHAAVSRQRSAGTPAARARADELLFARRAAGDPRAREALIERFVPLARSIARRYDGSGESFEDLMQVASLGLIKAVDRYDPDRGCAFSSFAVPTIVGELKRHFRDRTWTVRPPRDLQQLSLDVERAAADLWQRNARPPTIAQLAAEVARDEEHVLEALEARGARNRLSLQASADGIDDCAALEERIGVLDAGFERAESRMTLDSLMDNVSPRAREILRLRFEQDMTQQEIGDVLSLSQMQVSRSLRDALDLLRHVAGHRDALDDRRRRAHQTRTRAVHAIAA